MVYTTIKNAGNQNGGFMPMTERRGRRAILLAPLLSRSRRDDGAVEQAKELGGARCWPDRSTSLLARSPSLPIPRAPRSPFSRARPTSRGGKGASPCAEAYRQQQAQAYNGAVIVDNAIYVDGRRTAEPGTLRGDL